MKGKILVSIGEQYIYQKIEDVFYDDYKKNIVITAVDITDDQQERDNSKKVHNVFDHNFVVIPYYKLNAYNNLFYEEKIDDIGSMYPVAEFAAAVDAVCFLDSDGHGYPSDGTGYWSIGYGVKDLAAMEYHPDVTHIIWYNK